MRVCRLKLRRMNATRLKALVGANVKMLREKRGLSQEQLAVAIDRTWQAVSHIETGRTLPPLPTLGALATVLGVTPAALLSEDAMPVGDRRSDLLGRAQVSLAGLSDDQLETAVKMLALLREGFGRE